MKSYIIIAQDFKSNLKAIVSGGIGQLRTKWKLLLLLYLPILFLFMVIALVSRSSPDLTISYFTRDVTTLGDVPFYAGLLSQLGMVLWSATAAICLFTVLLLRYRNQNPSARRFLTQAGILTLVLLLDDVYLVHDSIFPEYLHLSEKFVFIAYFVWFLVILLLHLREILDSEYSILGLSLLMFGVSIFFDGAHLYRYEQFGISRNVSTFLEDAPKFVAIATWLLYFTRYAILKQMPISVPATSFREGNLSPLVVESFHAAADSGHDGRMNTRR